MKHDYWPVQPLLVRLLAVEVKARSIEPANILNDKMRRALTDMFHAVDSGSTQTGIEAVMLQAGRETLSDGRIIFDDADVAFAHLFAFDGQQSIMMASMADQFISTAMADRRVTPHCPPRNNVL